MADIVYKVNQDLPENIAGFEHYSDQDKALLASFQVNSTFDPSKNYSELHILSLSDELLESDYNYTGFKQLGNAQSAGQAGASVLTIDPIEDSKALGYVNGGVKLLYHFLDDLYTQDKSTVDFYIQDISTDRTELSLASKVLSSEDLVASTTAIKDNLKSQSYFTGFRLNFKQNDLLIATNIDTLDSTAGKVVVVKLYEPLPAIYGIKSILNIVDLVSDSVAYEVDSEYILPATTAPSLRSPNFNIDVTDYSVIPTKYFNYNDLFSYPVNNSNNQIYSAVNELGAEISVDYTDFGNFVHFSSAQERLLNFKYKLDLINTYSASLASIANATTGLQGISGSRTYYENLISGVVSNFDHYERFVYYESGSSSWPKTNTTKPYINQASNTSEAISWYANQVANAIAYDQTNYNSLAYSIPTFLRDDPNNENYLVFVYMIGQHFDNLWLYSKAVTDKYDADNRLDYGISKDLVGEALRNFGVKLYTSNKSAEDLFTTFIGQAYQSGSEKINHYITGSVTGSNNSIQPSSYDNYQKEVQKRIYHNLPLLLKSKGTERGLRALINCLGIPGNILNISLQGGRNTTERPLFGDYLQYTSSLDKIRLDNTGSIVTGSTLSQNASIIKRDNKYTDDLHAIEVGFAPVANVDNYIRANITGSFNIEEYLGDPRYLLSSSYESLQQVATTLLSGSLGSANHYDLQDYIRLIKFYDNTVFKMIKDFIPARAVADTGVIIKPNLLNRSKAKSVTVSVTQPEYAASIDTAFTSGSDGGSFGINNGYTTAYSDTVQTPLGIGSRSYHLQQEAKYDGEFSGSIITVSTRDLNNANIYKYSNPASENLYVTLITDFPSNICVISISNPAISITSHSPRNIQTDFSNLGISGVTFTSASTDITSQTSAYTFPSTNYITVSITASNGSIAGCSGSIDYTMQYCDITNNNTAPYSVLEGSTTHYDVTTWFTTGSNTQLSYTASWNANTVGITVPTSYQFTQPAGTTVTITSQDSIIGSCNNTAVISVVAAPYECSYLSSVAITNDTHLPGYGSYTYTPCNNGVGGTPVTVEVEGDWHVAIPVDLCIVKGSLTSTGLLITYGPSGSCII